jgi:hypothetical protein
VGNSDRVNQGLGVPYNEVFELANALPSLEEFQTTTGTCTFVRSFVRNMYGQLRN